MNFNQKPLIALSCVLFSCTSNDPATSDSNTSAVNTTYEVVSAAALPSTITSYISSKYAGSTTTEVNLNSDGTYVTYVSLAPGTTAKTASVIVKMNFTAKGILLSKLTETTIAVADLLPAITTYISTNYSGATINGAHSESDGSFDVIITNADGSKIKLEFKADGTFLESHTFKANGNHNHNHANSKTPIAIADLATTITAYINANYTGATITSAHKESDGSFDVKITTAAGANLNLNFSTTGNFVSVSSNGNNHSNDETPIAITNLMVEITNYITTNYPNATITSAEKDWNGGFEVYITTAAGVRIELNFSASGTFVVGSDSNNNYNSSIVDVIIKDLLTNIKTYITSNYAGATISEAHLESYGGFEIKIITSSGTKLKLYFTSTGVFISVKIA